MSVTAVHRYYHEGTHDHLYTNSADEIGTTVVGQKGKHDYKYEGVAFTVFNHHHAGLVPVYRYWQGSTHDHLYTTNAGEIGTTTPGQTGNHGYTFEGVLGYVSPNEFPGAAAILRYWQGDTHDHLYTVNAGEIGTTTPGQAGNHGYKFEGVLGYAYPAQHDIAPVYRYWSPATNDHLYTTNAGEIGTTTPGQTGNHGYTSEGVGFYIFAHQHAGLVPVYRYWQGDTHDHLYTANAGEIGTTTPGQTGNHGYKFEGILGYVSPNPFHGGVPIHRYWKDDTHDHFYTTNEGEIGTTTPGHSGNHGYKSEGAIGYVPHA
jgi:hypothetical protein